MRLMWAFGNTQMTLGILLGLEFCGLVVLYPAFHFWAKLRRQVKPGKPRESSYFQYIIIKANNMVLQLMFVTK